MDHAGVAANIIASLMPHLRGTGCKPFGSALAVQTGPRPYADDGERNMIGEIFRARLRRQRALARMLKSSNGVSAIVTRVGAATAKTLDQVGVLIG